MPLALLLGLVVGAIGQSANPPESLKEQLWGAARKGDVAAIESLLARQVDVNAATAYGATALHYAADKGHVAVVKLLLQHHAKPNVTDKFYLATPMSWAQMHGHVEIIDLLLKAGASTPDAALLAAVGQERLPVVTMLLARHKIKPETLNKALVATENQAIVAALKNAGAIEPAAKAVVVEPKRLASYAGEYRGTATGDLQVIYVSGRLALMLGGRKIPLAAVNATTFKGIADDGLTVSFAVDQSGAVKSLTLKRGLLFSLAFERAAATRKPTEAKTSANPEPRPIVATPMPWPGFRGSGATGVADGQQPPVTWDLKKGINVRWKTAVAGLGHSCPVVWGNKVFVTTAISGDPKAGLRTGQYGDVDSVMDATSHTWKVICLDAQSGTILWEQVAHRGVPKCKRHMKSTHANCTAAVDDQHVVVSFGSEGLFAYDHGGKLLWRTDLGHLDSGWFYDAEYQWGFGSSPVIYQDKVIVQCDIGKGSFIAAYTLGTGKLVWQTPRDEIPSWGSPTVIHGPHGAEVVCNASKFVRGYDPKNGKELWRLGRHSEISVPTPFVGAGLLFVCNGYRPIQPIYAIRPGSRGDLTLSAGQSTSHAIAWSTTQGSPYMPTPIVYGAYFYACNNAGILTVHEAQTGKKIYTHRMGGAGGYTASPVAADGRLYFCSEEGGVKVVKAGPKFELLATNPLEEPCLATPAISNGALFIRTAHHVYAFAGTGAPASGTP